MGWPRDTVDFPEPTTWNGDDDREYTSEPADEFLCPVTGKVCEWWECRPDRCLAA
jgi:hypothetical protein